MIPLADTDDDDFLAISERLLVSEIGAYTPLEVYLVKIDGWFDTKWLGFSGKVLGALGVWNTPSTIPPFHPNRVVSEMHFKHTKSEAYERSATQALHILQPSASNIQRTVRGISESAVFLWYSSGTASQDRGSTMLYGTKDGCVYGWYASFHRRSKWVLDRHRGISPLEINHLLSQEAPSH